MSRLRRCRRTLAVLMVAGGVALLLASPVVAQDEVRTQTDLLGYDVTARAAPVTVRIFENFIPIPADPGEPQLELTASHTSARLGSGPSGRAVASSIWPGPALGDGFGTVVGDESQTWPIRATARYPGSGEGEWQGSQTIDGVEGFGMHASARGLDVTARSGGGGLPGPVEPLVALGQVRSRSNATVQDGQAIATGTATISELRLLEGTIVLKEVATSVTATSDGEAATTDGHTSVGAIEVLGQQVRLTGSGPEVVPPDGEEGDDSLGSLLDPVGQVVEQLTSDLVADGVEETLGIHIDAVDHEETIDGTVGERTAGGLRITVELQVLRDYLSPLLQVAGLNEVIGSLPSDLSDLQGLLFEALALGPTVEFVVARGMVVASASPAFEASGPAAPPPPPPPATAASGPSSLSGSSSGSALSPPTTSGGVQAPQAYVAPPADTAQPPAVAASEAPPVFRGIPLALAALTLFLAAVPTYGLTSLREQAVGAGANIDPPRPLPDLRGGA